MVALTEASIVGTAVGASTSSGVAGASGGVALLGLTTGTTWRSGSRLVFLGLGLDWVGEKDEL